MVTAFRSPSSRLAASTRLLIASAKAATMARPRPVPPAARVRSFQPAERFEHLRLAARRDTGAMIADRQVQFAKAISPRDQDRCLRRAIAAGIVEQAMVEQVRIGAHQRQVEAHRPR